jgi:hypothetical protein
MRIRSEILPGGFAPAGLALGGGSGVDEVVEAEGHVQTHEDCWVERLC